MLHPNRYLVYSILLNIPINYHPMNPFPAPASFDIADRLTKTLPTSIHHRYTRLAIGDILFTPPTTSVASTLVAAPTPVASTTTVDSLAAVVDPAPLSDLIPTLHPNLVPIALDTGASISSSDFLPVAQASYGLFRSSLSVVSQALASTPVDPYTLITGEDIAFDLSSPDTTVNSNSDSDLSSFTKVTFDIKPFGTSTLTFIYSKSTSELLHIFVDPTQIDWIHWVPLPRLILPESYYHIFGLDYLQAFALFHLIPIWIALVSALLRSE